MVNVGTLLAFVMVCTAVLVLRSSVPTPIGRFAARCFYVMAPAGSGGEFDADALFAAGHLAAAGDLAGLGLVIYFAYSRRHSLLTQHLLHEIQMPDDETTGTAPSEVMDEP